MQTDPQLLIAFNLMWGSYPAAASLVHRSRTIAAVNEACRRGGREPGMNCATWPSPTNHKGCLAGRCLAEQKALSKEWSRDGKLFRTYWLPVAGYPDYYVHFTTEAVNTDAIGQAVSEAARS